MCADLTPGPPRFAAYAALAAQHGLLVSWVPSVDEEGRLSGLPVSINALRGAVMALHKLNPPTRRGGQTLMDAHLVTPDRSPGPVMDHADAEPTPGDEEDLDCLNPPLLRAPWLRSFLHRLVALAEPPLPPPRSEGRPGTSNNSTPTPTTPPFFSFSPAGTIWSGSDELTLAYARGLHGAPPSGSSSGCYVCGICGPALTIGRPQRWRHRGSPV